MTIKDIARLSGCSVSTISRVINNRQDVKPETKERVLRIMEEVGFVPNANAQQLKIQQSRNIVFVVKSTSNAFFANMLVQLQSAITAYGYNGVVSYLKETDNEMDAVDKILRETKPKGIIFLGGNVHNFAAQFKKVTIPCVLATVTTDELKFDNLSMVGVDDRQAAYKVVSQLVSLGHRDVAIIGGPQYGYPSLQRLEGAKQALAEVGAQFDPELYGLCGYDLASSHKAVEKLLAAGKRFTAVFCMSDTIAIGAMRALVSAGLRIPEDVSVVGFDGLDLSRYTIPVLTTITQPVDEIARHCAELLVNQLERGTPATTVLVDSAILPGESVAPPKQ